MTRAGRRSLRPGGVTSARRAFTLVELLVVIAILLLLTTITVMSVNALRDNDRIRSSARMIQSTLLGARDRALHEREVRGVRFLRDPANPLQVSSMVYIGPAAIWRQGTIQIGRFDNNNDGYADGPEPRVVRGYGTGWTVLRQQGLLVAGVRMRLNANGSWYTVADVSYLNGTSPEMLVLTQDYRDVTIPYQAQSGPTGVDIHAQPAWPPVGTQGNYMLELVSAVLPGQEPKALASGIRIDLAYSTHPLEPREVPGPQLASPYFVDVLFSPRGTLSGPAGGLGMIHFVLRDLQDIDAGLSPAGAVRDQAVVTLFTQSGSVQTFPVDALGPDGAPGAAGVDDDGVNGTDDEGEVGAPGSDDLFEYARSGSVAQ